MAEAVRWTYAFIDRPAAEFDAACEFLDGGAGDEAVRITGRAWRVRDAVARRPRQGGACLKAQAAADAGFTTPEWNSPETTGFFQPLLTARVGTG